MPDADFQAKLEAALTWAGIWSPGQRCIAERTRLRFFAINTPRCHHAQHHNYDYDGALIIQPHDIPRPPLTDELAMRLISSVVSTRAIRGNDIPDVSVGVDSEGFYCTIGTLDDSWCDGHGDSLREAIVLAVAALAEAEQGKQG